MFRHIRTNVTSRHLMERTVLHRRILLAGGIWNLVVGAPLIFLTPYLPHILNIDEPRYPIFIFFNLMTVTMFGFVAIIVSRHVDRMRPLLPVLMWSKLLTFVVFVGAIVWLPMPYALTEFLAGGMLVDLLLGFAYGWIWWDTSPVRQMAEPN